MVPLVIGILWLIVFGKISLVDVYDLSVRYLSWMMVLFGDPLYRLCFKPDGDQQKAAQVFVQNGPFPVSPTQVVFRALDTA